MFSGIIASLGEIVESVALGNGVRLTIRADQLPMEEVGIGDSIAVNGTCLTVVSVEGNAFIVEVSAETLRCTTGFNVGKKVNLERALSVSSRLDGHLVSGHVDGVGQIVALNAIEESWELIIDAPESLAHYIAPKGSIAVNGVSLTTNTVDGRRFSINLIPHTMTATTFHTLKAGDRVNLEIDLVARYLERLAAPFLSERKC